jgi:hypothetical protein
MEGGKDYIKEKKWDIEQGGKIDINKVYYINNGVDLQDFDSNRINFNDFSSFKREASDNGGIKYFSLLESTNFLLRHSSTNT